MTPIKHAGCRQCHSFGSLQYCQCVTSEQLCHVKCDFENEAPPLNVLNLSMCKKCLAHPPLLKTPRLINGSTIKRSDLLSALMKDAAVHIYIKKFPKHPKHTLCADDEYTATRNTRLSAGM